MSHCSRARAGVALISRVCVSVCLVAVRALVLAQTERPFAAIGGPLTGPPVLNAPFTAEATAIFTPAVDRASGERRIDARYYRDAAGRVRLEQSFASAASHP